MRRYLPLVCLALLHTVVDTSALLVSPLWDRITVECGLVGISLVAVMLAHSMPTSLSQGVFGFLRERRRMRVLLLIGPLVAAVFAPVYYIFGDGVAWYLDKSLLLAMVVMALLLAWRHAANINRLFKGTESKLGAKKA